MRGPDLSWHVRAREWTHRGRAARPGVRFCWARPVYRPVRSIDRASPNPLANRFDRSTGPIGLRHSSPKPPCIGRIYDRHCHSSIVSMIGNASIFPGNALPLRGALRAWRRRRGVSRFQRSVTAHNALRLFY